jgi:hypothetical protein
MIQNCIEKKGTQKKEEHTWCKRKTVNPDCVFFGKQADKAAMSPRLDPRFFLSFLFEEERKTVHLQDFCSTKLLFLLKNGFLSPLFSSFPLARSPFEKSERKKDWKSQREKGF